MSRRRPNRFPLVCALIILAMFAYGAATVGHQLGRAYQKATAPE